MRNLRLITSQLSRIHKPNRQFCTLTKPSDHINSIVDDLSNLTLLEVMDLTELLRKKLSVGEMPVMAMMMPGMGFGGLKRPGGGGDLPEPSDTDQNYLQWKDMEKKCCHGNHFQQI
ncbi:hypothetical protein ACFE04_023249 [Oxalis oulophora]